MCLKPILIFWSWLLFAIAADVSSDWMIFLFFWQNWIISVNKWIYNYIKCVYPIRTNFHIYQTQRFNCVVHNFSKLGIFATIKNCLFYVTLLKTSTTCIIINSKSSLSKVAKEFSLRLYIFPWKLVKNHKLACVFILCT